MIKVIIETITIKRNKTNDVIPEYVQEIANKFIKYFGSDMKRDVTIRLVNGSHNQKRGYAVYSENAVYVYTAKMSDDMIAKVICHELGHLYLKESGKLKEYSREVSTRQSKYGYLPIYGKSDEAFCDALPSILFNPIEENEISWTQVYHKRPSKYCPYSKTQYLKLVRQEEIKLREQLQITSKQDTFRSELRQAIAANIKPLKG